jgi:HEAT repeat protein
VPYAGAIAELLKDPDSSVRAQAADALDTIAIFDQQAAAKFASDVAALLNDKESRVRDAATEALKAIGEERFLKK